MKRCSKWNVIVPLCLVLSETVSLSEQSFKWSAQQPQTCSVWSRSSVDGEQVRSLTFSRNVNPSVLHGPCVKGLSDWYWALWEHGPVCVCVCVLCCAGRCVCVQVSSELFFIPFNKVEWYEMMARSDCVEESSASIAGNVTNQRSGLVGWDVQEFCSHVMKCIHLQSHSDCISEWFLCRNPPELTWSAHWNIIKSQCTLSKKNVLLLPCLLVNSS